MSLAPNDTRTVTFVTFIVDFQSKAIVSLVLSKCMKSGEQGYVCVGK